MRNDSRIYLSEGEAEAFIREYIQSGFPDKEIVQRIRAVGPSVIWIESGIQILRKQGEMALKILAAAVEKQK